MGEHEPEEKLIGRFRREVFRAGIIQECKRRRYFETNQEKRKRKTRDAARRNRKRERRCGGIAVFRRGREWSDAAVWTKILEKWQ